MPLSKEDRNQRNAARKAARVALGLCADCGNGPLVSKTLCGPCLQKKRNLGLVARQGLTDQGLCWNCGENPALPDSHICLICQTKDAAERVADKQHAHAKLGGCCQCCHPWESEWRYDFLQIDHMNGNGGEERRSGRDDKGAGLCKQLIKRDFPPGYQLLCANCNSAMGLRKGKKKRNLCPHEIERREAAKLGISPYEYVMNIRGLSPHPSGIVWAGTSDGLIVPASPALIVSAMELV